MEPESGSPPRTPGPRRDPSQVVQPDRGCYLNIIESGVSTETTSGMLARLDCLLARDSEEV